jgi:hypothetical protein
MRFIIGIIFGALLTVGGVYIYDSLAFPNGGNSQATRTIVNWDVASTEWQALTQRVQQDWVKLSAK